MRERTPDLSPEDLALLDDVEGAGLHVVHVEDDLGEPICSYSVGLFHQFEQPEVIVFGMPDDVATDVLDAIADAASEGAKFLADSRHDGLLHGYPVRFLAVPAEQVAEHLPRAVWAYADAPFPVVQMVWPDKQGRWPWQEGVREGFREAQPVLGRREPS